MKRSLGYFSGDGGGSGLLPLSNNELPTELVTLIGDVILPIDDLMTWYACCKTHWNLYVTSNREEWLKKLTQKSAQLEAILRANTSLHVEAYRNYMISIYSIQITKLCKDIELYIPTVYKSLIDIGTDREVPFPGETINGVKPTNYRNLGHILVYSDIRVFNQCRVFIKERFGWILSLEDSGGTYNYP
jgi:hypothetical protein